VRASGDGLPPPHACVIRVLGSRLRSSGSLTQPSAFFAEELRAVFFRYCYSAVREEVRAEGGGGRHQRVHGGGRRRRRTGPGSPAASWRRSGGRAPGRMDAGGGTSTGRCSCWGGSTTATSSGCTGSLKATTTTTGSFRFSLCLCPAMLMFAMIHPVAAFGVLVS
jgi:hypothetical protein